MSMVRMRFSAPLMHNNPTLPLIPQRYLDRTRVANPLEGRTGKIVSYDTTKGTYHLVFNDGYEEDVHDSKIDSFVIRAPLNTPIEEMETLDPLQLLGSIVHKTITSYEGIEEQVTGSVASYISDSACYRIVFSSGLCEDWSQEVTQQAVETSKSNPPKRKIEDSSISLTEERALNQQKFPSRSHAYGIIRKVLRGILEQATVKSFRTEKQWTILNNKDMQPRRALTSFVEANGLKTLQQILMRWMSRSEYHAGAMLVLKILAVLPGITPDIVLVSGMGRVLKLISRASRNLKHVAAPLGDLADWIILTWQREIGRLAPTTKNAIARQTQVIKENVDAISLAPTPTEVSQARAANTKHLMELMKTPPPPVMEEPEFRLPEYNSLGSVTKRRRLRRIIHIESIVERAHKNMEETMEEDERYEKIGKIQLGRPEVIRYNANLPVNQLLSTTRSTIIARREESHEEENQVILPLPNKRHKPLRSILKQVEDQVMIPVSKIQWN